MAIFIIDNSSPLSLNSTKALNVIKCCKYQNDISQKDEIDIENISLQKSRKKSVTRSKNPNKNRAKTA